MSTAASRRPRLAAVALAALLAGFLLVGAFCGPAMAQVGEPPERPVTEPAEPIEDEADGDEPAEPADDGDSPVVPDVPDVTISVDSGDDALSRSVVIVLLLTIGSIAPGLLLLMTTFTRFVVVLGLAKNALALQTVPPSQVLVGLALFLSLFTMGPVLGQINDDALQPFLAGEIGQTEAVEQGFAPLRDFMLAQTRQSDLAMFTKLAGEERPAAPEDVPATTLIPAFVISELRTAFIIGFVIFIPFLVIDLVVAAVLMSMGMVMLPPVFISLPLKLLLFVLVDGWVLIVGSLVGSVNAVGG